MEQPSAQDTQNVTPPPPPPLKKLPLIKAPLIGFLVFVCLVASAAAVYKLTGNSISEEMKTPPVTPTITTGASKPPEKTTQAPGVYIYALKNGTSALLGSYVPTGSPNFGISSPVFDNKQSVYYLIENRIYHYDLEKKVPELFAQVNNTPGNFVQQLRFLKPNTLSVTEAVANSEYNKDSSKSAGNKMHIIDATNKQSRVVHNLLNVFYGGNTFFMNTPKGDVIGSFGGDACSGWGEIHLYQNDVATLLSKTGIASSPDPHFVSVVPSKNALLLFAVLQESVETDGCPYNPQDVLYLQDVVTGEKTPVLDLKPFVGFQKVLLHDSEEKIAITTEKEIHIYNLLTNRTEKIIQHTLQGFTFDVFAKDMLFAQNRNGKSVILSSTTEQYEEYTWQDLIESKTTYPQFLGVYDDSLLFLKIVNEN